MITNKDVFAKRNEGKAGKEGALDEAYQMALQLMNAPCVDDWDFNRLLKYLKSKSGRLPPPLII